MELDFLGLWASTSTPWAFPVKWNAWSPTKAIFTLVRPDHLRIDALHPWQRI